jgi:hypothetical protein
MNEQEKQDKVKETVRAVIDQREEILRAFVAKYECGPEEIMQVMQKTEDGGVLFSVRRKTETEESLGAITNYIDRAIDECSVAMRRANIANNKSQAVIMKVRTQCFREIKQELRKRMLIPAGEARNGPVESSEEGLKGTA